MSVLECNLAKCSLCSSPEVCEECDSGFTPAVGGCELNCDVSYCATCDQPDQCGACIDGYELDADNNLCGVICDRLDCAQCNQDGTCSQCEEGLVLVDGTCTPPGECGVWGRVAGGMGVKWVVGL